MNERINDILCKLHDDKIDVNLAIKDINAIQYKNDYDEKPHKCAKRIKIYINAIDDENSSKSYKINLPALPIRLIKGFGLWGIKVAVKYSNKSNTNIKSDDINKIKYVFDALTMLPPFEIVSIDSEDAKIHIYTC